MTRPAPNPLPVLIAAAGKVLLDVGITVAAWLAVDWWVNSGMTEDEASEPLAGPGAWIGGLEADLDSLLALAKAKAKLDAIAAEWAGRLSVPATASLAASVALGKRAIDEGALTAFEALALERGIAAKAKALSGVAVPGLTLSQSPEMVELQGQEMSLVVGGTGTGASGPWAQSLWVPVLAVAAATLLVLVVVR
jgi:hypothetical protein